MSQTPKTALFKGWEVVGLLLLVATACASLAWFAVWTDLRNAEEAFRQRAYAFEREVAHRMASAEAVLTSLVGLHHASDDMRNHEFEALSRELLRAYPHIRTIAQLSVIRKEELKAFEQDMRASGFVQFKVTKRGPNGTTAPADSSETVVPIVSLEPFDPEFANMVGFDILSDPPLEAALQQAVDSGLVVSSDVIKIPYVGSGYFAFKAIYLGYDSPTGTEARRAQFRGAVALYVDGAQFFESIAQPFDSLAVRLAGPVSARGGTSNLVYRNEHAAAEENFELFHPFQISLNLMTQGRTFLIEIDDRPAVSDIRGWFFSLFVVLPALAGGFLILALANQRRARRQALEDEIKLLESRKQFQDYAEVASDWYWATDADLRFSYISEQFTEATGIPTSRILGKTRASVSQQAQPDLRWQKHMVDLAAHRPFRDFRYSLGTSEGKQLWFSVSGKPVFDQTGAFLGYRGTGQDITAEMEAAADLRLAKEEAELASRTKSEFLANMSHELRTPLNAIIGFSEILKEEFATSPENEDHHQYAGNVFAAGQHLLAIINEILDLSKIESGNSPLDEMEVDLAEVIASTRAIVAERAHNGNVAVEYCVDADLPGLWADGRKLKQVLINLLSNGLKFTAAGGKVTFHATITPEGACLLEVADNGIGIAAKDIPKALAPFQQIDSELNRKYEGTGLGLPLTKAFVEQHGGTLRLQSELGKGTTASVLLPASRILRRPGKVETRAFEKMAARASAG